MEVGLGMVATASASMWDKTFGCGFCGPGVMRVPAAAAQHNFLHVLSAEGAQKENKPVFARLSMKPMRFVLPL